jgi:exodeoxyribonuclease VII small subunit
MERLRIVQRKGEGMAKAGKEISVTLETLINGEVSEEQVGALSFEQALKLLEEVVASVESGTLPLDRAIGSYEHGTALIKHLRKLLSGAEEKLRVLNQA